MHFYIDQNRLLELNQSKAESFVGTPAYMSPELFKHLPYNHKVSLNVHVINYQFYVIDYILFSKKENLMQCIYFHIGLLGCCLGCTWLNLMSRVPLLFKRNMNLNKFYVKYKKYIPVIMKTIFSRLRLLAIRWKSSRHFMFFIVFSTVRHLEFWVLLLWNGCPAESLWKWQLVCPL